MMSSYVIGMKGRCNSLKFVDLISPKYYIHLLTSAGDDIVVLQTFAGSNQSLGLLPVCTLW